MGQKFFISFNSADRTKAHWIAWILKEAGHGVAVHDWEISAGGNAPLWMNTKLAWADRLIAVISPDYVPARYSPIEWAAQIWNDPDGTKGSVIPIIVRPTSNIPPLLRDLSRIDLTNCSEDEAKNRLIKGVDMPAPPERKPAFEKITGEAPDSQHAAPADKPTFVQVSVDDGVPRWLKLSAAIGVLALAVFAALTFFIGRSAMFNVQADRGGIAIGGNVTGANIRTGDTRTCETKFGGQVVCGNLVIGITLEQYEAGLKKRAEEIRAEEAEKRIQVTKFMELTERATSAEKDSLRDKVAAVEAEKRALEAESKGAADRVTNLQASYEGLVQRLGEANAALEEFAPLISKDGFAQAQAMLSGGDLLGAERKFVEIADRLSKIPGHDEEAARAIFEAGKLAEERIDWRAANAHFARAAKLQPSNWQYTKRAGDLAHRMGDYATAASFKEATLTLVTSAFGPEDRETATALNNLAITYRSLARYTDAEPLLRRAIEIHEKALGKDHPNVATDYNNLANLLSAQSKYDEAEPLYRRAIEIDEKALGKDHPGVAGWYNNLANLLSAQSKYNEAEPLYRRAIEIDEKVLGRDHPSVAINYNNLASLLKAQGKYDEAEPLLRRAIEIHEKALGKDHPNVATDYNNLANLLSAQSKYDEAEPLYRRAIEIGETVLGKDHPRVAASYNDLALLLEDQGKYDQAEPLIRRAIEINEKVLGRDHPGVAINYNNLASLLRVQGKYDEAEPLYRRAMEILQTKLGLDHPNTVTARKNYDRLQELKQQNVGNTAR